MLSFIVGFLLCCFNNVGFSVNQDKEIQVFDHQQWQDLGKRVTGSTSFKNPPHPPQVYISRIHHPLVPFKEQINFIRISANNQGDLVAYIGIDFPIYSLTKNLKKRQLGIYQPSAYAYKSYHQKISPFLQLFYQKNLICDELMDFILEKINIEDFRINIKGLLVSLKGFMGKFPKGSISLEEYLKEIRRYLNKLKDTEKKYTLLTDFLVQLSPQAKNMFLIPEKPEKSKTSEYRFLQTHALYLVGQTLAQELPDSFLHTLPSSTFKIVKMLLINSSLILKNPGKETGLNAQQRRLKNLLEILAFSKDENSEEHRLFNCLITDYVTGKFAFNSRLNNLTFSIDGMMTLIEELRLKDQEIKSLQQQLEDITLIDSIGKNTTEVIPRSEHQLVTDKTI